MSPVAPEAEARCSHSLMPSMTIWVLNSIVWLDGDHVGARYPEFSDLPRDTHNGLGTMDFFIEPLPIDDVVHCLRFLHYGASLHPMNGPKQAWNTPFWDIRAIPVHWLFLPCSL